MKRYYELLGIDPKAPPEEIKRSFRLAIAKYHPDKVQHLGREFQEMAQVRAAELTEAYRTLMDPGLRAEYDLQLDHAGGGTGAATAPVESPPARAPEASPQPAPPVEAPSAERMPPPVSSFSEERASRDELVRKATLARFRAAVAAEMGAAEPSTAAGFDVVAVSRPKARLFGKAHVMPRVLGRFVPRVDAAAVQESWVLASRSSGDGLSETLVFLMGAGMAPRAELAEAIAEQRRRHTGSTRVVVIPVDARDWNALVPTDAPPVAKALLSRLRAK